MTMHFFESEDLAMKVCSALIAKGVVCGTISSAIKEPKLHCCTDDCCRRSPCVNATYGVQFSSRLTQRQVHEVAIANGGHHVFRGSRCAFCGARE